MSAIRLLISVSLLENRFFGLLVSPQNEAKNLNLFVTVNELMPKSVSSFFVDLSGFLNIITPRKECYVKGSYHYGFKGRP